MSDILVVLFKSSTFLWIFFVYTPTMIIGLSVSSFVYFISCILNSIFRCKYVYDYYVFLLN